MDYFAGWENESKATLNYSISSTTILLKSQKTGKVAATWAIEKIDADDFTASYTVNTTEHSGTLSRVPANQ